MPNSFKSGVVVMNPSDANGDDVSGYRIFLAGFKDKNHINDAEIDSAYARAYGQGKSNSLSMPKVRETWLLQQLSNSP